MNKLEAALTYASWGWYVLPVVPNGKIPATRHGVHDATTDQDEIRRWWTENPEYNIGVAAGEKSGIVVFDIDPRNGGDASWENFKQTYGECPDTIQALTAGGGEHFLANYAPHMRSCKVAEGIDFLANGRYFLACPSDIEGRKYEWEASSDPFEGVAPMAVPEAWNAAFEQHKKTSSSASGNIIQGNRNDGLTSLAGYMRAGGMAEPEILAAISMANETRCEVPLPSSEIQQIVRSIVRYEPDHDVAASSAAGSEAAENLLDHLSENPDYFLTRATSFLNQPSPIPWVIKGWIPSFATIMIYGESGVGKTFVALDMAAHIASGKQWAGIKTKPGRVVYLAGEGIYGLRQRLASWSKANNNTDLDSLLISNKPIDLDAPDSALQVIKAVRALTDDDISLIVIDTLNNHMSGDENSARDTRAMINSCNLISSATGATTAFLHHVAHAADAKARARGSSAWRGALDTSILVASEEEGVIKITCTKMKDAQKPKDIFGELEVVDLGWVDEDNEPITGAVFRIKDYQPKDNQKETKKVSTYDKNRKLFENAWWASGSEVINNQPYISRSALVDYLINNVGLESSTANKQMKPSIKGGLISDLLIAEHIKPHENGWVVVNENHSTAMILNKNG